MLQGREGIMFVLLAGTYFTIQSITERNHAIFGPLVNEKFYEQFDTMEMQTAETQRTSQEALWHYMKDQQHALQALVWMSAGVVGLALRKFKYATGIHFVYASMAQTAMIFFHPQMNGHATVLHKMHAIFLLISSIFRYTNKILEFSLLATISSGLFLSSSSCLTMMAGASHIDEIGYMLSVIVIVAIIWGYFMAILFETLMPQTTQKPSKTRDGKEYNRVLSASAYHV